MGHQLWHKMAWSFQQGKLHDLFLRDGITFATWGLVIVTGLLVWDSWRRGTEQRDRWKQEDQRRNDRVLPRCTFGIEMSAGSAGVSQMVLWCANLGSTNFSIQEIARQKLGSDHVVRSSLDGVVFCNEKFSMPVPRDFIEAFDPNSCVGADSYVWLKLAYSGGRTEGPRLPFHFMARTGHRIDFVKQGLHEVTIVPCAKCGPIAYFGPYGKYTEEEAIEKVKKGKEELDASCPDHHSEILKFARDANGKPRPLTK